MIDTSLFEQKWKQVPSADDYGCWEFRLMPYHVESRRFEMSGRYDEVCAEAEHFFHYPWNPIYLMS